MRVYSAIYATLFIGALAWNQAHATGDFRVYSDALGTYDAATRVFDMSASSSTHPLMLGLRGVSPAPCSPYGECWITGNLTFSFTVASDNSFGPGVFALFGTVPDLGITAPTALITGLVTGGGGSVWSSYSCGSGWPVGPECPAGTSQGDVLIGVALQTLSADPLIAPYWQTEMFAWFLASTGRYGASPPFQGSVLNNSTLFEYDWAGAQHDYWFLGTSGNNLLPESGTLALLSVGLAGLGLSRRRMAAKNDLLNAEKQDQPRGTT